MRKILYIIIIAAVLFAPVDRLDIAKLLPVEAVAVYRENDTVVLKTDTDNTGRGKTVWEALKNLKDNAVSMIYLDTADYLLIGKDAQDLAAQLQPILRRSIQTGSYCGGDIKTEAKYLDTHQNAATATG